MPANTRQKSFFPCLEAIRGLAATYVVFHHISSNFLGLQGTWIGQPFRFGVESVLVFFLLSGFVISHAAETGPSAICWKTYIFQRIKRIYPIFIAALAIAHICVCISEDRMISPDFTALFANLGMFHDLNNKPGVWFEPYCKNLPLWSLSYELTFYFLYLLLNVYSQQSKQLLLAAAISYSAIAINQITPNPWCNFASLFIIWWSGVEMARRYRSDGHIKFLEQIRLVLILLPPLLFYSYLGYTSGIKFNLAAHPFYEMRFFAGAIVLLLLIPLLQRSPFSLAGRSKILVMLGGISYAIYAFHYPIICNLPRFPGEIVAADLLFKVTITVLLAWLAEKKLQPWINKVTKPLFGLLQQPRNGAL